MFELFALGIVGFVLLAVFGVIAAVASMLWWIVALPFKLLAFAFKGLAALLALPFMILFGLVGFVFLGLGFFVFLIPAIPFLVLGLLIWMLFRRRDRNPAAA